MELGAAPELEPAPTQGVGATLGATGVIQALMPTCRGCLGLKSADLELKVANASLRRYRSAERNVSAAAMSGYYRVSGHHAFGACCGEAEAETEHAKIAARHALMQSAESRENSDGEEEAGTHPHRAYAAHS